MSTRVSLARMYYPVKVLGPGKRVGIWLNGCNRRCEGCISPEMQRYDESKEVSIEEILRLVGMIKEPIEGFTLSGGEPFYRPAALRELVSALVEVSDDVLIYTGYTIEELRSYENEDINAAIGMCAVLIDGQYIKEYNDGAGLRGSSNQRCWVFKHPNKYSGINTEARNIQTIVYGNRMVAIGIPRGESSK